MYSNVIVPLDGSELAEQALPYARLVAGSLSVPIELVTALDALPLAVKDRRAIAAGREMMTEARRASESYLTDVRQGLRDEGIAASWTMLPGTPDRAIVERASHDRNALVVMSTHGRGGITRWALGSVADKVLHTTLNPMLIAHPGGSRLPRSRTGVGTVLVPLDGSRLAELSLPHAMSLATHLGVSVELLLITSTADHYRGQLGGSARRLAMSNASLEKLTGDLIRSDADEVSEYLTAARRKALLENPSPAEVATRHLLRDDVAGAIIERATEMSALVVMSTHGRSGLQRLVMGSVTDRVIRHSNIPLVVVRGEPETRNPEPGDPVPVAAT